MNLKKDTLKFLIYNHHKKFTSLEVWERVKRDISEKVTLEEIIRILDGFAVSGFIKEYRERKGSNIPPRYQAEPGYVRKLVDMIEL